MLFGCSLKLCSSTHQIIVLYAKACWHTTQNFKTRGKQSKGDIVAGNIWKSYSDIYGDQEITHILTLFTSIVVNRVRRGFAEHCHHVSHGVSLLCLDVLLGNEEITA